MCDYDGKIAGLYDLENTIGRGHFAVVKLARHVFTGEKVAVKVIDKTKLDEVSKAHLFQEVRCMKLVQHPNVVRLYEVIDTQSKLYLILELGDGGDMYDYIMKHKGVEECIARNYFRQIVEAIAYCHRLHVVHRDLKPENVVFFEKHGLVKLTDFGFSNMFKPGKKLDTSCGSLAYSAPEILLGDAYDAPAVDIWSLGVILYMLVCGEPPFQEANDSETLTMIMDCKYHLPSHISQDCKRLISKMLIKNPNERLTLTEIISDPWLNLTDSPSHMLTPLISRQHLSEDDQNIIIQRMVEGNIASRDEILSSLAKDSYDHITSTFYLLAERRLKKHQAHVHPPHGSRKKPGDLESQSRIAVSHKLNLEPLALSPRIQPKIHRDDPEFSLSSPSQSAEDSGRGTKFFGKCSLINEELMELEDDDDIQFDLCDIKIDRFDEARHPHKTAESENISQPRRSLTSVATSPVLLNQITEEGESDDEPIPTKISSTTMIARQHTSPDMVAKYERRRRRAVGQRGASCSSSDASDTDDTETRCRNDLLKHKIVQRRDSGDLSSDNDGGGGATGVGGAPFGITGGKSSNCRVNQNQNSSDGNNNSCKDSNDASNGKKRCDTDEFTSCCDPVLEDKLVVKSSRSSHSLDMSRVKGIYTTLSSSGCCNGDHTPVRNGVDKALLKQLVLASEKPPIICSVSCQLCIEQGLAGKKLKTDINSNGLFPGLYVTGSCGQLVTRKHDKKCCSIF